MNDTNKKIEQKMFSLIQNKTCEERAIMGFSMFESAREIVLSTIENDENLRYNLFLRFYGNDFDDEFKEKIKNKLKEKK